MEVARPPDGMAPGAHLAVTPYPRQIERNAWMPDGRTLLIRPIRPEDASGERAHVRAPSTETRRPRFMAGVGSFRHADIARMTQIDYAREIALVAVLPDGDGRQVGVARYAIGADDRTAEFAVVVDDAIRGHGIGTLLMGELMAAAQGHGADRMVGDVSAVNRPILALVAELGFTTEPDPADPAMVRVACDLRARRSTSARLAWRTIRVSPNRAGHGPSPGLAQVAGGPLREAPPASGLRGTAVRPR